MSKPIKLLVVNDAVLQRLNEMGLQVNPDAARSWGGVDLIGGAVRIAVNKNVPDETIWCFDPESVRRFNEGSRP